MLRLIGCVLVLAGSVGAAGSICREGKKRLQILKQIQGILEDMKYYISYQKAAVPEALWKLSDKENVFSEAFKEIYIKIYEEGENFPAVWSRRMEEALEELPLSKEEKELVLGFPACLGFMEENAQAGALDGLLREITLHAQALAGEQKNRNKVIMSVGAAAGILISILLI